MASYGFLWRRRLASYGRRRLGFLWSPPWLPMVAALASYGLLALASYGLLALLACNACLLCFLALLACSASLHCLLALLACFACLLCLLALLACFACLLCLLSLLFRVFAPVSFVCRFLFAGEAWRPVWGARRAHPAARLGRKEGRSIFPEFRTRNASSIMCKVMCDSYVPRSCAKVMCKRIVFETNCF